MPRIQDQDHWVMLLWLVLCGLIAFGLAVSWNEGLLAALADGDKSRISLMIGLLYFAGMAHCARRAGLLSAELELVARVHRSIGTERASLRADAGSVSVNGQIIAPHSILADHLLALSRCTTNATASAQDAEHSTLVDILVGRAKGSHDIGWFLVDILLKLGLIGTIVGFILMLSSVANTASLDVNTMQKVLKQMSAGMGTALFTTLAGLTCSILLGMQYLLLDKGADVLLEQILRLSESRLSLP